MQTNLQRFYLRTFGYWCFCRPRRFEQLNARLRWSLACRRLTRRQHHNPCPKGKDANESPAGHDSERINAGHDSKSKHWWLQLFLPMAKMHPNLCGSRATDGRPLFKTLQTSCPVCIANPTIMQPTRNFPRCFSPYSPHSSDFIFR